MAPAEGGGTKVRAAQRAHSKSDGRDERGTLATLGVPTGGTNVRVLPPPPTNAGPSTQPSGNRDMSAPAFPTIFTLLGKLGLELKQQEATLPVHTVERVERSAAD